VANSLRSDKQRAQPGDNTIHYLQIRTSVARSIDDQELMLGQDGFGADRPGATGTSQLQDSSEQV
jgi:hypothetical protein